MEADNTSNLGDGSEEDNFAREMAELVISQKMKEVVFEKANKVTTKITFEDAEGEEYWLKQYIH